MGSLCCCPGKTSYRMNEDNYDPEQSESVNEQEKRQRAAEAAEKRLKDAQRRGVTGESGGPPLRKAHADLPGNVDSNLRWQMN